MLRSAGSDETTTTVRRLLRPQTEAQAVRFSFQASVLMFLGHTRLVHLSAGSVHSMHTHVHLARTNAEKEFPGHRILTVDRVEYCGFGIERQITADPELHFICGPQISNTAKCITTDSKGGMIFCNPQQCSVCR